MSDQKEPCNETNADNENINKMFWKESNTVWNEKRQTLHPATPSVIRKGLCMVQNKSLKKNNDAADIQTNLKGVATKAAESSIKYGAEIATAFDPLAAAIAVGGKVGIGVSLSRFSASQCAGIVGVIVSTINPQTSVPLLLKKISEDLDYLKESLNIVRENAQYMANEFLSIALQNLDNYNCEEALNNFEKAEYEATKGVHMAPTFLGFLRCVQMKVFASVMMECASNLEGIPCFIPIHCLHITAKNKIEKLITGGLATIMKRAETRKWNGKKEISSKTQDIIDPFLASLYNTYSLSAGLTKPYQDCTIPPIGIIEFTIDVTYIPEGENDNCKLEVLQHETREIVLFTWKESRKGMLYVFLRHKKTTWTIDVTNGNLFTIEFNFPENTMTTSAGELEKTNGWPIQRMSLGQMIDEAKLKMECKAKKLSHQTYKWIKHAPLQYITSMDLDLDDSNDDGITLLHVLSTMNETNSMKCFIDKVQNVDPIDYLGETPLHKACLNSSFKAAKLLIEHGANVNALTKSGESPLTLLSTQQKCDISLFKILLDMNAKRDHVNNDHMRAIDIAKQSGLKLEIKKLLKPVV